METVKSGERGDQLLSVPCEIRTLLNIRRRSCIATFAVCMDSCLNLSSRVLIHGKSLKSFLDFTEKRESRI